MKYIRFWAPILASLILFPVFAWSQVNLGSIRGDVQDSSHAAVPGAQLTLKNESTGVSQSAKSSAAGEYGFLNLPAGAYTLSTEATGFSTAVQ